MASHQPARMNQITFPTSEAAPASERRTSVRPNGHRQNKAMRADAIPNGIASRSAGVRRKQQSRLSGGGLLPRWKGTPAGPPDAAIAFVLGEG